MFLLYLYRGRICNKVSRFRKLCGRALCSGTAVAAGGEKQGRARKERTCDG